MVKRAGVIAVAVALAAAIGAGSATAWSPTGSQSLTTGVGYLDTNVGITHVYASSVTSVTLSAGTSNVTSVTAASFTALGTTAPGLCATMEATPGSLPWSATGTGTGSGTLVLRPQLKVVFTTVSSGCTFVVNTSYIGDGIEAITASYDASTGIFTFAGGGTLTVQPTSTGILVNCVGCSATLAGTLQFGGSSPYPQLQ